VSALSLSYVREWNKHNDARYRRLSNMDVTIAVTQINCYLEDVRRNLQQIERIVRKMRRKNVDIACFPEFATTGYSLGKNWRKFAEHIPGPTTDRIGEMAREYGHYLIIGLPELDSGRVFDSTVLVSPREEVVGIYRKVHLWGTERKYLTPGEKFSVFKTDFAKVGMGICYDLEFPESARVMAIQGAQIIFFPSAEMKPLQTIVTRYLQTRASENQVYVAFANRVGREGATSFFGGSLIISPDSRILASCSGTESVAIAKLDLKKLTRRRTEFPYLKHRIPMAYTPLGI